MQRRVFLRSGALALVTMGLSPSFLRRAVYAQALPRAQKGKVLICLFQRGAADALNIVVPHGDASYYALRPNIAIARPGAAQGAIAMVRASSSFLRCAAFGSRSSRDSRFFNEFSRLSRKLMPV